MARARALLELHEACDAIDIYLGDDFLCRINRAPL
jgi:hypothetical protein